MPATGVADSTVLIFLAKLGHLRWLNERFDHVLIPSSVHKEVVVEGRELGKPDALAIEEAIEAGSLQRVKTENLDRLLQAGLTEADGEVVALALREDGTVCSDDMPVRQTARTLGLDVHGTLFFFMDALRRGEIDLDGYLRSLEDLADAGFRFSGDLMARAVQLGREISNG